jgi:hypothetical protein
MPVGAGAEVESESCSTLGAILYLPEDGSSQDSKQSLKFQDLAYKHAEDWFHFANVARQRMASNGSLCLVTGWAKSKSWGLVAFSTALGVPSFL